MGLSPSGYPDVIFTDDFESWEAEGTRQLEIGFYSYHLDKKGPWGENYPVQKKIPIQLGTWHCIERHMKLNSVDPTRPWPTASKNSGSTAY